jgi:hypothetical protein
MCQYWVSERYPCIVFGSHYSLSAHVSVLSERAIHVYSVWITLQSVCPCVSIEWVSERYTCIVFGSHYSLPMCQYWVSEHVYSCFWNQVARLRRVAICKPAHQSSSYVRRWYIIEYVSYRICVLIFSPFRVCGLVSDIFVGRKCFSWICMFAFYIGHVYKSLCRTA